MWTVLCLSFLLACMHAEDPPRISLRGVGLKKSAEVVRESMADRELAEAELVKIAEAAKAAAPVVDPKNGLKKLVNTDLFATLMMQAPPAKQPEFASETLHPEQARCVPGTFHRSHFRSAFPDFVFPEIAPDLERAIPARNASCPYLLFYEGMTCEDRPCPKWLLELARARDDIIWVNYDLGDHALLVDDNPFPGVTVAPPAFFSASGVVLPAGQRRPMVISYSGNCQQGWYGSSHARLRLKQLFADVTNQSFYQPRGGGSGSDPRVHFHCAVPTRRRGAAARVRYMQSLVDSAFVLVPHGDGRWNFRFSEVIGAGAVPVVIADGLTLPYAQLIDWDMACVRISESVLDGMASYRDLLALLPSGGRLRAMQRSVARINERFFATARLREDALLDSARALGPASKARRLGLLREGGMQCGALCVSKQEGREQEQGTWRMALLRVAQQANMRTKRKRTAYSVTFAFWGVSPLTKNQPLV